MFIPSPPSHRGCLPIIQQPFSYSHLLPGLNNTNPLAEEIQKTFPDTMVIKTLNTMWCGLMDNPKLAGNVDHINFISGARATESL
jgi:hypothetical protein